MFANKCQTHVNKLTKMVRQCQQIEQREGQRRNTKRPARKYEKRTNTVTHEEASATNEEAEMNQLETPQ